MDYQMPNPNLLYNENQFGDIREKLEDFYKQPENSNKYFFELRKYISEKMVLDLSSYRENYLHRRFYYRIIRLNLKTYKEYLDFVKLSNEEPKKFIESFTIHVTEFFRDEKPFRYLEEELFFRIAKSKFALKDKTIRILSAPCSTGEEAYSLAIIIDFLRRKKNITNAVEIYACDIDIKSIEYATMGIYPRDALKKVTKASILQNFNSIDQEYCEVKPILKQYIKFFIHDLLKPLPYRHIDLVVCRNFLIYISKNRQQIIINNIIKNMEEDAYLMLGKTEGFPLLNAKFFVPENLKEHIYRFHPEQQMYK